MLRGGRKTAGLLAICMSMALAAAAQSRCVQPPNTTMVAWYPFDELSGTVSANLATHSPGTQVNGPIGIPNGKVGPAAGFKGQSYVRSASTTAINFGPASLQSSCSGNFSSCSGDFSIDTWIQVTRGPLESDSPIVDKRGYAGRILQGYFFFLNQYSLGLEMDDASGKHRFYSDPISNLFDGNWHLIAVTVKRTSSTGITFYHNGGALSTTGNPVPASGSLVNTAALLIATESVSPLFVGFYGNLDELEIYNRELTSTEVGGIFSAGSAGKCKPAGQDLASCVSVSSESVLTQGRAVTVYVPRANWQDGSTGVQAVPVEPTPVLKPTAIPTALPVTSCASNSVTGQTVCVGAPTVHECQAGEQCGCPTRGTSACVPGKNDVYLLTGTKLNQTLQSSANGCPVRFSGGFCCNCSVAMDALHNEAAIEVSTFLPPSGSGLEILGLTPDGSGNYSSFTALATHRVSENIQVDPHRGLYLSPSEDSYYDLFRRESNSLPDYSMGFQHNFYFFDSAAEDCTTGIALASIEGTPKLFITDLTQASFTPPQGWTGTWTAPYAVTPFPEFANMSDGTAGIAVVPGRQLAVVTGEFFGTEVGIVGLPGTSGSGTPAFGDYVAAYLPNTPDGLDFKLAGDPHAATAYLSPANGRGYGVVAGWRFVGSTDTPTYLAILDLQGLLDAPRCNGTGASKCVLGPHEVDPTIDLTKYPNPANPLLRYVSVF